MIEKQNQAVGTGMFHPPVILGIGLGTVLLQKVLGVSSPLPRPARPLGIPLILMGLVLGGAAVKTQYQAGTPVDPDQPTRTLVQNGPYRITRNPIYLSFAFIISGVALLFNAFWTLPLVPGILAILDRGMVQREEDYLEKKFGQEYTTYKQKVPRWL
jgi:protein-S-isoprenylcysteine O-methyltransferase Ste14